MAEFTYSPDYGADKTVTPKVQSVDFGDGYSARNRFGLNTQPQVWNLTFSLRTETEANAIEQFFIDAGGVDQFDWTPPGESTARKFICKTWTNSPTKPLLKTVTAQFTEVFDP